jgi:hypothetical protein
MISIKPRTQDDAVATLMPLSYAPEAVKKFLADYLKHDEILVLYLNERFSDCLVLDMRYKWDGVAYIHFPLYRLYNVPSLMIALGAVLQNLRSSPYKISMVVCTCINLEMSNFLTKISSVSSANSPEDLPFTGNSMAPFVSVIKNPYWEEKLIVECHSANVRVHHIYSYDLLIPWSLDTLIGYWMTEAYKYMLVNAQTGEEIKNVHVQ